MPYWHKRGKPARPTKGGQARALAIVDLLFDFIVIYYYGIKKQALRK